MSFAATKTPIKRLGLVTKYVTGLSHPASLCRTNRHCERIVSVVSCGGHRQPDDQGRFVVKITRREYQEWMGVSHFAAHLRVAIYPDDVLAIRYPWSASGQCRAFFIYHRSAPMRRLTMASPPCRAGSK